MSSCCWVDFWYLRANLESTILLLHSDLEVIALVSNLVPAFKLQTPIHGCVSFEQSQFLNDRCLTTKSPIVFLCCWQETCTPFMADKHTHTHTDSHSHTSSVFYCDIGSLQDLCWKNIAPEELGQSCPEWTNSHQHTTTTKGRIGPEWINSHWQHRDGWMDWCLDVVQSWNPLFGCGLSSKHNNFFCQVHKSSFSLLYKENCKQRGPSNSWSPLYS
jgi:hypothetical protein